MSENNTAVTAAPPCCGTAEAATQANACCDPQARTDAVAGAQPTVAGLISLTASASGSCCS